MEQIETRQNAWPTGPKPGFLELLSPPSSARVPFQPRLTPSDDSLSAFGQHLLAGLHDTQAKSEIKDLHRALASELSELNHYAINLAIQDLARESAQELSRSLVARLRAKVGDQVQIQKSVVSEQTKKFAASTVGTTSQDSLTERPNGENINARAGVTSGAAPEGVEKETSQLPKLVPPGGPRAPEAFEKTIQHEDVASPTTLVNPIVEDGVSQLPSYEFIIFAGKPFPCSPFMKLYNFSRKKHF